MSAEKAGCSGETLRNWVRQAGCARLGAPGWVRQAGRDQGVRGVRGGQTRDERERIKALERENRELGRVKEMLRKASAHFAEGELDRRFRP